MAKKVSLITMASIFAFTAAVPCAFAGISWARGYTSGMQRAKSEGKPAMLDFTASWCGWCKKLDKETFTDPRVQELARSFVCVKVDADKEKHRMREWEIKGIPHILFLDSDGNLLNRVGGYKPADAFAKEMEKALGKFTPPERSRPDTGVSSSGRSSQPLLVRCPKCGSFFNTSATKGYCPRCGEKN